MIRTLTLSCVAGLVGLAVVGAVSAGDLDNGRRVYEQQCASCHNDNGDGNGPASVWLFPKPRNFNRGQFKIQSTPMGSLPTDEDLFQTITRGMPGSSMPAFNYLDEQDRRDVVDFVKGLAVGIDSEGEQFNYFERAAQSGQTFAKVEVPSEPADLVNSLNQGRIVFGRMGCAFCHGETGAGDGPMAKTLVDDLGIPNPPRDFNSGSFRGGHTGKDLYLRIHNGLAGTKMPAFGEGLMTPEDRWAIVHYIQSLRRKDVEVQDMLATDKGQIKVFKVDALPEDPMDDRWGFYDPVRVALNPLWPEPQPVSAVGVIAIHDGVRLMVRCSWPDPSVNGTALRVQDFQDALALQFSLKGTTPFIGMGDRDNPVNIWFWRASWQEEVDEDRPEMRDVYPSMHADVWLDTNDLYMTAIAAGNVVAARHESAVEDSNASGFGTMKSQPLSNQNVKARAVWHDGFWNLVITRDLAGDSPEDVVMVPGGTVPVAFAVWNGEQEDRNGRKVISNWHQLVIEDADAAKTANF